ncbi:hypothetical protein [Streptomyces sp. NBC_01530]|uniref:hypothetical protein n=1 Tax=Streptomyces sp. NBC_01530 TaxID=2903895 RepID=UPI00386D9BB5
MSATPAEQAPTLAVGALPEPDDLDTAARVAQYILSTYGTVGHEDVFALNQAYGAVREALRILLRAVGAQPDVPGPGHVQTARCPAAHPEDPTPCVGPVVVTVLDAANAGADGCEHHGTRLLASLDRGRVYALPDAPAGAAIRVFKAAGTTRPFPWVDGPRTRPEQLSHAENRRRGDSR